MTKIGSLTFGAGHGFPGGFVALGIVEEILVACTFVPSLDVLTRLCCQCRTLSRWFEIKSICKGKRISVQRTQAGHSGARLGITMLSGTYLVFACVPETAQQELYLFFTGWLFSGHLDGKLCTLFAIWVEQVSFEPALR